MANYNYPSSTHWSQLLCSADEETVRLNFKHLYDNYSQGVGRAVSRFFQLRGVGIPPEDAAHDCFVWIFENNQLRHLRMESPEGVRYRFKGYLAKVVTSFCRKLANEEMRRREDEAKAIQGARDGLAEADESELLEDLIYQAYLDDTRYVLASMQDNAATHWRTLLLAIQGKSPEEALECIRGQENAHGSVQREYSKRKEAYNLFRKRVVKHRLLPGALDEADAEAEYVEHIGHFAIALGTCARELAPEDLKL